MSRIRADKVTDRAGTGPVTLTYGANNRGGGGGGHGWGNPGDGGNGGPGVVIIRYPT